MVQSTCVTGQGSNKLQPGQMLPWWLYRVLRDGLGTGLSRLFVHFLAVGSRQQAAGRQLHGRKVIENDLCSPQDWESSRQQAANRRLHGKTVAEDGPVLRSRADGGTTSSGHSLSQKPIALMPLKICRPVGIVTGCMLMPPAPQSNRG